jgi:hypothetical protein
MFEVGLLALLLGLFAASGGLVVLCQHLCGGNH